MTEMTAVEYLKEKARMTKTDKEGHCKIDCDDCPLHNNGTGLACCTFEQVYPERAVAIVQKWSEEHLRKTILQVFLEHYPDAYLGTDGHPRICPRDLGYGTKICLEKSCGECWYTVLEG